MFLSRGSVLFVAGTLLVILVGRAFVVGDPEERLLAAVPEFTCPDLAVTTHSGHRNWSGGFRSVSSAAHMSKDCRERLEEIVAQRPDFSEEPCGSAQRCWVRTVGDQHYRLVFETGDADSVGFHFSEYR